MTATVGTPGWYAWLETATAFTFVGEAGTFTAHKARAGNRRGGWYWRAYRRKLGHLSRSYLGVSANLTLPCLREAARRLAARAEGHAARIAVTEQAAEVPTTTSPARLTPILLLHTKFALPRLPVQHVARPHLLALVEQAVQRPVTLVSAPAGSGKTTLLAEWAATTTLPVVWLSCDAADNDPARFLSYLLAQLGRLDERGDTAVQGERPWYERDYEQMLTGPLNELALLLRQDAVLLLDDYHLITTDAVHAMLHFVLEHLPARLHLLFATRVDPPLPLARLRARNQVSELRIEDLRFAPAEVEAFARSMGLALSREALRLLEARTEGWIAGIQLLALALRGHADAAAFLQASGGTHRFLLDYVGEEVLAQQTSEMQRFLLRTCVLDQLTGPLCEAVTGEPGGQAKLAAALRANLFVSALDDTETWYRYHPLFAEALRARLHRLLPELVPALYRRASDWYEQQQREEEACEYALLAGDQPRAATLLEHLIPHLLAQGKVQQVGRWLARLAPALVDASPMLWVASISMHMLLAGIRNASEQVIAALIEQMEQRIQAHAQENPSIWAELQAGLPVMRAIAALGQGDHARAIALALNAPPTPGHPESALSQFIGLGRQVVLGAASGASGDLAAVEQMFFAGAPAGAGNAARPRNLAVALALADLYEAHGQLHKLGRLYDDLLQDDLFQELVQSAGLSPLLSALIWARAALLWYEWNQLPKAEGAAKRSMELAERLDRDAPSAPLVTLPSLWTQARLALARGDDEHARHLLERAESAMTTLQSGEQSSQAAEQAERWLGAIRARLALACGQLELAARWGETCGLHVDDAFPSTVLLTSNDYLAYGTLARVLIAQGRLPGNGSKLAQAALLLERLHRHAVGNGWQGRLREIELLTALTLQAQGKVKRALTLLGAVLAQAEPEGYIRLFADEGAPMAQLLARVAPSTPASPGYLQQLQAAFASMPPDVRDLAPAGMRQTLPDRLSPREQEVLRLLAEGFSNQQIADHLVISLNTAKRHVRHLLAKLTVTNRTQAVVRARELHLL